MKDEDFDEESDQMDQPGIDQNGLKDQQSIKSEESDDIGGKLTASRDKANLHKERVNLIIAMFKGRPRGLADNETEALQNYKQIEDLKNQFQCERVDHMNLLEYQQFEQCRQSNLLSRGRKLFAAFLGIEEKGFDYEIDALAYTLRFIIRSAVELATLDKEASDEKAPSFKLMTRPIAHSDYEDALNLIVKEIKHKI